jgi:hypothetical protein
MCEQNSVPDPGKSGGVARQIHEGLAGQALFGHARQACRSG